MQDTSKHPATHLHHAPGQQSLVSCIGTPPRPIVNLAPPFQAFRLTPLRRDDAQAIHDILKQDQVRRHLQGPPDLSYTLQDAKDFIELHSETIDIVASTDWEDQSQVADLLKRRWLFSAIRNHRDEYVGGIEIRRNRWEWLDLEDPEGMMERRRENDAKQAGDPSIVYSIGYYLSPDYQGQGIMSHALRTALGVTRHYMNATQFEGICGSDNHGSRNVFEKNGFRYQRSALMSWKGGRPKMQDVLCLNASEGSSEVPDS